MTKVDAVNDADISSIQIISTETVQSRIYGQLRSLLMSGKFPPGHALKVVELADAFGVSAQPVRESIRQLVAERALEALPNRSARVPEMTPLRLEELRRVRITLETLAADLALDRATDADIVALRALIDVGTTADDANAVETSIRINKQFHFTLYAISGSETLMAFIETLWLQIGPMIRRSASLFDAGQGRGTEMHRLIVDALASRDKDALRVALTADIDRAFELYLRG